MTRHGKNLGGGQPPAPSGYAYDWQPSLTPLNYSLIAWFANNVTLRK